MTTKDPAEWLSDADKIVARLSRPVEHPTPNPQDYRQRAGISADRLTWAPALGNGAAITALAGIVANVPSPDTALSGLTIPLALFSLGLASGVLAIYLNVWLMDIVANASDELNRNRQATITLVAEAKSLVEGATPENAAERLKRSESLPGEMGKIAKRNEQLRRRIFGAPARIKIAEFANGTSVATIALGFSVLLIGHQMGWLWLEKPPQPPQQSNAAHSRP